jgi:hypothetical protein
MVPFMRSRARQEARLLREQDSVGALRDERREQETLGSSPNIEVVFTRKKREERERQKQLQPKPEPRRTARPGKPLKR